MKEHIRVVDNTGATAEESKKVVAEWIAKFLGGVSTSHALIKLLSHLVTITLRRVEDGEIFVSKYELVPVLEGAPATFAITSAGAILSAVPDNCVVSVYRKALYKFLLTQMLGLSVVLELPEGYQVAQRDVLSHSASLTFVGSTYWTNEDAIRKILHAGLFKSQRVAIVRDLFDRHLQQRPHLDSMFFTLDASTAAVSDLVLGSANPKRRIVQEYTLDKTGTYQLSVNDMELGDYLKLIGFTVLVVPASISAHRLSLLSLGNKKFAASTCQKELAAFYSSKKADISIDVLPSYDASLLDCSFISHSKTTTFAATNAIKQVGDVPVVHQPIQAYKDATKRQTSNKILMVAPIGFLSSAQTALDNYFMNKTTLPEYEVERKALAEYSDFHRALTAEGVRIALFRNERFYDTPDAVFPNNWFSTHPPAEDSSKVPQSRLVLYPMKAPARRAERREHIVTELLAKYDKTENMSYFEYQGAHGVAFEGTGSLVLDRVNKVAYCALSQRADEHVFNLWCEKLGYKPCVFAAQDDHGRAVYHTNVVMGIGSSVAVVCAEAVADAAQRANLLKTLAVHHTVVQITHAQMNSFCGNVLEVAGAHDARLLVMSSRAFQAFTKEQHEVFARHVKKIVHVPVPTIEDIGGGGVRCMLGELF